MWGQRIEWVNPYIIEYERDLSKGIARFHVIKHAKITVARLRKSRDRKILQIADELEKWKDTL